MYSGTFVPAPGMACTVGMRDLPARYACSSSTSCGKESAADGSRRNARRVVISVPGARPRPRSMRSPKIVARVPNCSAITNGEWFGSMTPPEPKRMRSVWWAMWPISTEVALEAMFGMLWCSAYQMRS